MTPNKQYSLDYPNRATQRIEEYQLSRSNYNLCESSQFAKWEYSS